MKLKSLIRREDFIVAFFIFLFASISLLVGYKNILSAQKKNIISEYLFKTSKKNYFINSNSHCVGWFQNDINDSLGAVNITGKGSIMFKKKDTFFALKLESYFIFTPSGELTTSAVIAKKTADLEYIKDLVQNPKEIFDLIIALESNEINPIKLKFIVNTGKDVTVKQFSMPGPIEIKRVGFNSYNLKYKYTDLDLNNKLNLIESDSNINILSQFKSGLEKRLKDIIFNNLKITVVSSDFEGNSNGEQNCFKALLDNDILKDNPSSDSKYAIDIEPLLNGVKFF